MAFEVISTDQVTTYTIDAGDDVVLLPGVNVTASSNGFDGNHDSEMNLTILGTVASNATAVELGSTATESSDLYVYIGSSGQVLNTSGSGTAVYIQRTDSTIINHGEVLAGYRGVLFDTDVTSGVLINTGTITTFADTTAGHAVYVVGDSGSLSGTFDINNSGLIHGADGINVRYQFLEVINTGTISGEYEGIQHRSNSGDTSFAMITNFGVIHGGSGTAIQLDDGNDVIINHGDLSGAVDLGDGVDTYRAVNNGSSGVVSGDAGNDTLVGANANDTLNGDFGNDYIRGGAGNDLLDGGGDSDSILGDAGDDVIIGGSSGADTIRGGSGDDHITGGSGAGLLFGDGGQDTIIGGVADDIIWGGTGEDSLEGGVGNDTINGGSGRDEILGGDNNDMLRGGGEADAIYGETGDDTLQGGAGDDTLAGGLGRDILNGGSGADDFRFTATNQSAVGALRDTIQDFEVGIDTLDLGAIPGTLAFVGTGPLTGTGPEVRAAVIGGGAHTLIQIDADGNGTVDSEILLTFSTGLTEDDFIL